MRAREFIKESFVHDAVMYKQPHMAGTGPMFGKMVSFNYPGTLGRQLVSFTRLEDGIWVPTTESSEQYLGMFLDILKNHPELIYRGRKGKEDVDEMALPADWDPAALGHDKTFKSRLEYALQRAPRLGGGSSRVAFTIPDNGRETVLKVAKNAKGMAQNEAEVDILADGYTGKLDIVIPIVDYDKENPQPTWIQTELAKKVSQQKLSKLLHSEKLNYGISHFVYAVHNVLGNRKAYMPDLNKIKQDLITSGHSEQDIEIFMGYVDEVATLVNSSSLLVDDLGVASNWGEYNGRPVIIDLGFTEAVRPMYYGGR